MEDILKSIFLTASKCSDVRDSRVINSTLLLRWIPILLCWKPDRFLGISENGKWVVEEASGLRVLDNSKSFLRIEILVERPLKEIQKELAEFFNSCDIKIDVNTIFPFEYIVREVFEDARTYWLDLAFIWYEELSLEKKKMMKDSLIKIANGKLATQKLRHKAQKELKQINS